MVQLPPKVAETTLTLKYGLDLEISTFVNISITKAVNIKHEQEIVSCLCISSAIIIGAI